MFFFHFYEMKNEIEKKHPWFNLDMNTFVHIILNLMTMHLSSRGVQIGWRKYCKNQAIHQKKQTKEKNPIPEFTPQKTRSQSSKVQKSNSLSPKTARSASTKITKPEKNSSQSNKKARNACILLFYCELSIKLEVGCFASSSL